MDRFGLTRHEFEAATGLWNYHQLAHPAAFTDVGIVLGCHDIGVCDTAAELYHHLGFPRLVVTGAVCAGTKDRFPEGEANAFAARLSELAVPSSVVFIEGRATNTGQNITFTRDLLASQGIHPATVTLICMPYMQRRAWATCTAQWPAVTASVASARLGLADYLDLMYSRDRMKPREVIDNMVGDFQRIVRYPSLGFATQQPVPAAAHAAFAHLVKAGFDAKLLAPDPALRPMEPASRHASSPIGGNQACTTSCELNSCT